MEGVISYRWRGYLYAILGTTFICITNSLVKNLTITSVYNYLFFRSFTSLLIVSFWIFFQNPSLFRTNHLKLHFYRSSIALVGWFCNFIAIHKLDLLDIFFIERTYSIMIPFELFICLSMKISLDKFLAIICGFIATAYAINPTYDLFHIETLIALTTPICTVIFIILLRFLIKDSHLTILFYYFLFNTLISGCFMFFERRFSIEFSSVFFIGVLSVLAQFANTKANLYANPLHIGCINYIDVFIAAFIGWLIWNEPITKEKAIAIIPVICAGGYVLLKKDRHEKILEIG